MATTDVILTEIIPNLGAEADVVTVRSGFARNFLIPKGKALEVNPTTLRRVNLLKTKRAEREARELNDAEELARRINKLKPVFTLEVGSAGKAFGSVSVHDIAEKLRAELGGKEIERSRILLERAIKETGEQEIEIRLHPEVTAKYKITVKAQAEPAPAAPEGESAAESKPRKKK